MISYRAYGGLFVEIVPALERFFDLPEGEIRDGHLPEGEVMQVAILALGAHRLLIARNRARRLAATQAEPALGEQEEDAWIDETRWVCDQKSWLPSG